MKKLFLISCFSFILFLALRGTVFAQNTGIGILNPGRAKLEVHGVATGGATSAIFGGELTGISLQRNWPTIGFNQYRDNVAGNGKYLANGFAAIQYFDPNTGYMYLDMFQNGSTNTLTNSGTRALSISNAGDLAIKTNPVNASLYVIKAGNAAGAAAFSGTSYTSYFHYGNDEHTYIRGGKPGSLVLLNDNSGNIVLGGGSTMVGINSGNPVYTLEIWQVNERGLVLIDPLVGFNNWEQRVNHYVSPPASHLRLYYNGTGTGAFFPAGGYGGTISDGRVKTNITALPPLLDKIMQLDPMSYEMKDHNEHHERTYGFIAQDVKALFPPLVSVKQVTPDSVNRIPDLHALDYTSFSVIAIKALQDQMNQITTLRNENDILVKRLEKLEEKVTSGISRGDAAVLFHAKTQRAKTQRICFSRRRSSK